MCWVVENKIILCKKATLQGGVCKKIKEDLAEGWYKIKVPYARAKKLGIYHTSTEWYWYYVHKVLDNKILVTLTDMPPSFSGCKAYCKGTIDLI